MTFFDFNKIIGALLATCLFAAFLGLFSNALVEAEKPTKPGYALPGAVETAKPVAAAPAAAVPLATLLAKADADKGKGLTKVCATCHTFEKGAAAKVGPNLYGVVGRAKGSEAGFGYSDAMKAKGGVWTFEDLNTFITNPKAFVPGTKMGFGGEPDAGKRADLIAYLRTLSDAPVALPAAK